MGFGVWGLGFRVWDLGFGVWDLGFRAYYFVVPYNLDSGGGWGWGTDLSSAVRVASGHLP